MVIEIEMIIEKITITNGKMIKIKNLIIIITKENQIITQAIIKEIKTKEKDMKRRKK